MRRSLSLVLLAVGLMAVLSGTATAQPARDHAAGACVPVPDLLYKNEPVYSGDCIAAPTAEPSATDTALPTETDTPIPPTDTDTPAPTNTDTPEPTATATFLPTVMVSETPAGPGVEIDPYPNAPACESHDNSTFHALWNSGAGCHYDHEHGTSPFGADVGAVFPDFSLHSLTGGVEIGHTNPSSPAENTDKHPGFKWDVELNLPCAVGFEGAEYGVSALAVQYHAFGNYAIELNARVHSTAVLARQCVPGSGDYGYAYLTAHQDYGQMLYGYQGLLMPFPNRPEPAYLTPLGPYWAWHCIFCGNKLDTRAAILAANGNVPTTITSKGGNVPQQSLFNLLIRARDLYQVVDQRDQTHPFTSLWLCSSDGGLTYAALPGCRYNNSTTRVQEVRFLIPESWDNLAGWDTDPEPGRVTVEGLVTAAGEPVGFCQPGQQCFVIKLDRWRPGHTGATLQADKLLQFTAVGLPERDIYFCGGVVCAEGAPGAVSSGWIGSQN
jgi:hypothetical protein